MTPDENQPNHEVDEKLEAQPTSSENNQNTFDPVATSQPAEVSPPSHDTALVTSSDPPQMDSGSGVVASPRPSGKRGGKVVLLVALIAALVLVGGSASAYKLWYQNPDKVLADGISNVITQKDQVSTKTNLTISNKDMSIVVVADGGGTVGENKASADVTVELKSDGFDGKKFSAKLNTVMLKNGDTYIKVDDLREAVESVVDVIAESIASESEYAESGITATDIKGIYMGFLDPMIEPIDGQWIRLTANDTKDSDLLPSSTSCYQDVLKSLQDSSTRGEIAKVYKANQFVNVTKELGSKDGSLGYEISLNETEAKSFGEAAKDTKFGKAISKCDDSESADSKVSNLVSKSADKTDVFQIWISRWSHQITRVVYEGEVAGDTAEDASKVKLDLSVSYGEKLKITAPADAKPFEDVQKEITTASSGLFE